MARPTFTPFQRSLQASLFALVASGQPYRREMQQMKKKFEGEQHEAAQTLAKNPSDAKAETALETARKSLQILNGVEKSLIGKGLQQAKRGRPAAKQAKPQKSPSTAKGPLERVQVGDLILTLPHGFKRPAGRPSVGAPFGRSAKGNPLAPWGLKADGSIRCGPQGRKPLSAAKQAKVERKQAQKQAKVAYKAAPAKVDPEAPYGRKLDGTPAKKRGPAPKQAGSPAPEAPPTTVPAPKPPEVTVPATPVPNEAMAAVKEVISATLAAMPQMPQAASA